MIGHRITFERLPREDYVEGTSDHLTMAAASRRFPDAVVWLEHQLSDVLEAPGFRLRCTEGFGHWADRLIAQWEVSEEIRERRIHRDAARAVRRATVVTSGPYYEAAMAHEIARRASMAYDATATWVPAAGIWRRYCCDVRSNPRRPAPRPYPTKEAVPDLDAPRSYPTKEALVRAEIDAAYIAAGVLTPEEVSRSRFTGEWWLPVTQPRYTP